MNPSPRQETQSPEQIRTFRNTLADLRSVILDLEHRVEAEIRKKRGK